MCARFPVIFSFCGFKGIQEVQIGTFTLLDDIFESGLYLVLGKNQVFRRRNERVMLGERDERVER